MYFLRLPLSVQISIASASLGCLVLIGFLTYSGVPEQTLAEHTAAAALAITLPEGSLTATAAILYDPTTGTILYEKNSNLTLPLASITKLLTAHAVLASTPTSKVVTLSVQDTSVDSDAADWGLKVGDTITLDDLLKIGLVGSSNHAMGAAARTLGPDYIDAMNRDAASLGLTHTYFLNSTGLDIDASVAGAYGSAYDIARLAAVFLKEYPQYFQLSSRPDITITASGRTVTTKATTIPLLDIPGVIGAKTGFTDLAGGNLVMAYDVDINHPLIAVVLGSTQAGRFADIRTLVEASRLAAQAGAAAQAHSTQ